MWKPVVPLSADHSYTYLIGCKTAVGAPPWGCNIAISRSTSSRIVTPAARRSDKTLHIAVIFAHYRQDNIRLLPGLAPESGNRGRVEASSVRHEQRRSRSPGARFMGRDLASSSIRFRFDAIWKCP